MVEKKGTEVILGAKTDPLFGPIILFGMGGVGVELFKDYTIGLPPLNSTLIKMMMSETKIFRLLKGYRGSAPSDIKRLEETMLLFSDLLVDFPQIKEIDINPLLIHQNDISILDARIVIDKDKICKKVEPHEHLVISPYPKKYEALWSLKNGQEVLLRPIKPEDEPMWLEMFQGLSEESIRYRFFQMLKDTPHEVRVRYCNIDYDREVAIVAEIVEQGKRKLLGVGRLNFEIEGETGEMSFLVSDKWQGLGLGTKIVDYVLDIAREKGITKVFAIMLPDNYRALSLTKKMGFKIDYLKDGTVKGTHDLTNDDYDSRCTRAQNIAVFRAKNEAPKEAAAAPVAKQEPAKQEAPKAEAAPAKEASSKKEDAKGSKEAASASA
jgi:acetyltransferase